MAMPFFLIFVHFKTKNVFIFLESSAELATFYFKNYKGDKIPLFL